MIKISIITVSYNEENTIEKTILSVLNQTYNNVEYIIIDGNSTDNTTSIIKKYQKKIDVVISEKDNGIFDAQNKGIKISSGDYLFFLNAGDYIQNNQTIERIVSQKLNKDIVYGDIVFELNSGKKYRKNSPDKIRNLNMFVESVPHPAIFFNKEIFEKYGYYDTKYQISADYDFILKAIFGLKLSYKHIRVPIAVFNLRGISSTFEKSTVYANERSEIQKKYLNKNKLKLYKLLKPFIILIRKKLYYGFYYVKSAVNKNFINN